MSGSQQPGLQQPSVLRSLANGAGAAFVAETLTLPFDTAKVRLQLQTLSTGERRYKGPVQTIGRIIQDEGLRGPFKGWVAGLQRQLLFTGIRLGLYDNVKALVTPAGASEPPLYGKIAAALTTSAIGITVANPSDLVKVRFQACEHPTSLTFTRDASATAALHETGPVYSSTLQAYRKIIQNEGLIKGLYKGYTANLIRNSIISATELVTYDQAKGTLLKLGLPDGIGLHLASGLTAGLAATILGSPWDVIGTRIMAVAKSKKSHHPPKNQPPTSLVPFILHMARTEGLSAFYKGFIPNFARIGSFNIVLWLSYEQIKKL